MIKVLPKYVIVDRCPVPRQLAPVLRTLLRLSGATLNSCYRGADAEKLLHAYGKQSQTELYNGWIHRKPGYLPANPPGFSTHELRNDGAAYSQWSRGAKIPWWAVGIDIDDRHVAAFLREAGRLGYAVARTYPSSRLEYHHVNFRKPPAKTRAMSFVRSLVST